VATPLEHVEQTGKLASLHKVGIAAQYYLTRNDEEFFMLVNGSDNFNVFLVIKTRAF